MLINRLSMSYFKFQIFFKFYNSREIINYGNKEKRFGKSYGRRS